MDDRLLAAGLTRVLLPATGLAIERAICEQRVMDALGTDPRPATVADLLSVLERGFHTGGPVSEEIAALRSLARTTPELSLDVLAR